jgi:hypothetical protein
MQAKRYTRKIAAYSYDGLIIQPHQRHPTFGSPGNIYRHDDEKVVLDDVHFGDAEHPVCDADRLVPTSERVGLAVTKVQ